MISLLHDFVGEKDDTNLYCFSNGAVEDMAVFMRSPQMAEY